MSSLAPFSDARTLLQQSGVIDPKLIAYPNEPFSQPEPPAIWVAMEATGDVLNPIELPAKVYREEGTIYFHVMCPANWGSDLARTLAKNIANIFRGLPPRAVIYRGGSIGHGAIADTQGGWWMLTVAQDYVYDDTT